MTVSECLGISTSMFLRLCWRAPCTVMRSSIEFYERPDGYIIVARLVPLPQIAL
jgi:hypothetical protein